MPGADGAIDAGTERPAGERAAPGGNAVRGVAPTPRPPRFVPYLWGMVVSVSGRIVHDVGEMAALSPDWPVTGVALPGLLVYAWYRWQRHAWVAWTTLAWLGLNAVVGALSVLPLPFWPWDPAQTLGHYVGHVVYAAAQVPLAWWLWRRRGDLARPPSQRS